MFLLSLRVFVRVHTWFSRGEGHLFPGPVWLFENHLLALTVAALVRA